MSKLSTIAQKLGMAADSPRLEEAFTHRSYAVEHKLDFDNQRLEFLGDSVLEIILTEYLFNLYPALSEGDLTKIRSALACEPTLARLARGLDLGSALRLGNGEIGTHGPERESTLADLFEAMLGALYLECGFEHARSFVLELLRSTLPEPRRLLAEINPKGQLQELSQQRWNEIPRYTVLLQSGPPHDPRYEIEASVHGFNAAGHGRSRKNAELDAAAILCSFLMKEKES